ncbi:ABC-three component system protein [Sporolactobacillus pectinivorans]|uniref:ABC-three component system protein n=1 Tax=Sporolactobacillus pectinivorans TaxID=1591408 RepID=UPI000C25949B|nr:ABC-three component system protein [Sporolactobacillus pectinivorans]
MQDNRRLFSENEKLVLFQEVDGRCPICGGNLTHKKGSNIHKTFEIAHIYPANPRPEERELLKNEKKLSEDVNDLNNVIAVCKQCHRIFDTPRTIDEYQKWYQLKKRLIEKKEAEKEFSLFNIEHQISHILKMLNESNIDKLLVPLSYTSLKVDDKVNESMPYLIKRTITNDVVDYFSFVRNNFIEIDKLDPSTFELIATQVKGFYIKCKQINTDQNYIYNTLIDWLDEKTNHYSKRACEIVIAFFIQDCEVFS